MQFLRVSGRDVCPIVSPYVGQTHKGGELELQREAGNSTFGTGRDFQRKRRLKKRERERSVGMNQEKGGDSGSTLISQIHFWLVPRTVDTQPSTSTIFHIFFTRSPPPCFYFNRGSHLARKTRRHFPEMSTEKLKPSSYFNLVFPWNLRVNRETRSERSYIFYGITDFDTR